MNTWADLLVVNYIQNYDVATENTRTFDGLFNLSAGSSSSVDAFFFLNMQPIVNAQINDIYSVG